MTATGAEGLDDAVRSATTDQGDYSSGGADAEEADNDDGSPKVDDYGEEYAGEGYYEEEYYSEDYYDVQDYDGDRTYVDGEGSEDALTSGSEYAAADARYVAAVDAAAARYDATIKQADAAWLDSWIKAVQEYDATAEQAANDYDRTLDAADARWFSQALAAAGDYDAAVKTAEAVFEDKAEQAASTLVADLDRAAEAYDGRVEPAYLTYESKIADAWERYEAVLENPYAGLNDPGEEDDLYSAYIDAGERRVRAAWTELTETEEAAWAAFEPVERAAAAEYAVASSTAWANADRTLAQAERQANADLTVAGEDYDVALAEADLWWTFDQKIATEAYWATMNEADAAFVRNVNAADATWEAKEREAAVTAGWDRLEAILTWLTEATSQQSPVSRLEETSEQEKKEPEQEQKPSDRGKNDKPGGDQNGVLNPDGTITVTTDYGDTIVGTVVQQPGTAYDFEPGTVVIGTDNSVSSDVAIVEATEGDMIFVHDDVSSLAQIVAILSEYPDGSVPALAVIGHGRTGGCAIGDATVPDFSGEEIVAGREDALIDMVGRKLEPDGRVIMVACDQFDTGDAFFLQRLADTLDRPVVANEDPVTFCSVYFFRSFVGEGNWVEVEPQDQD